MSRICCFPSGPLETNAYLVIENNSHAFLVDPACGSFPLVEQYVARHKISLDVLCCTHSHWDHVSDTHQFLQTYPHLQIFVHPLDSPNLSTPGVDGIDQMVPVHPILEEKISFYGPIFEFEGSVWTVLHTPGHSPGSVCLYEPSQNVLFSGDTLFSGTFGATSFPTSSRKDMYYSLQTLLALPDEVVVYPGHGQETPLKMQKTWMSKVVQAKLKM